MDFLGLTWDKNIPVDSDRSVPYYCTRYRIRSMFKNFRSGERITKSTDSFGGFMWIRVDESGIRKEKVFDPKISRYG